MKKFLLCAALMLASVAASAQVYIGGTVGLERNTTDNKTNFTVAPEVGYNFNNKWAVGAGIAYNHLYDDGITSNVFGIAPYARYSYFRYEKVRLFVDGGFDLAMGKVKEDGESSDTATLFGIGFKPGVAFDLNDNFGLVAHFGFLGYKGANDAGKYFQPETIGFNFSSMDLNIGFYLNF